MEMSELESQIFDKLLMSVQAKYHETPLLDAVRVMTQITGLAMRIDEAALHAAGVTADNVKLTIEMSGSLRHVLDAMLEPHELTFVTVSGGILITTQEAAARR